MEKKKEKKKEKQIKFPKENDILQIYYTGHAS